MKGNKKNINMSSLENFINEDEEWLNLTPQERISETTKLWKLYIVLGGNLDSEPDPDSPFYFKRTSC